MSERRNRIKIALPLYGMISGTFLQQWLSFQSQIAQYDRYAGLTTTQRGYVDFAMNEIVAGALKTSEWDYLFIIEQDMKMPPGLLERIAALDPETHPIVGCLYFGRVQEDQRPVCGHMVDNVLMRLSYEQVCKMLPERGGEAGFHRVDVVGMGATAIHRSVLEKWPWTQSHPWFRTDYDDLGFLGHDIWFCTEAAKQGYPIYVDSTMIAEHLGEWRSTNVTYLASVEHSRLAEEGKNWSPPPTMMTDDELTYLSQIAAGKRVLEIGSQYGNSTVAMARTAQEVVAVDWFVGDGNAGFMNANATRHVFFTHLEQMGVTDKVVTIAAKWEDALPRLGGTFDLIFLDAFHGEEAVREQLAAVQPLLASDGLIAIHDYGRFGVKPAVDAFGGSLRVVDTLAVIGDSAEPDLASKIALGFVPGRLKPETEAALTGRAVEAHPLVAESAYFEMVRHYWEAGQTFLTIEQDIVPTPEQIDELLTCAEPWCAFEYDYPPFGLYAGMGCAKFSAKLLRSEPRAMEITGQWSDATHAAKHWCRVDGWLKQYLLERGHRQHIHGQVQHLHAGRPAHDCVTVEQLERLAAERVPA